MARVRANNTSGGGGAEWITPTISSDNKTATCSWDYDADTIIVMYSYVSSGSTNVCIHMYDRNKVCWYANTTSGGKWQNIGVQTWLTFNARDLTFNCPQNVAMSNVTVLPIVGKPNGYYA